MTDVSVFKSLETDEVFCGKPSLMSIVRGEIEFLGFMEESRFEQFKQKLEEEETKEEIKGLVI
jgi:hypothetical protein